VSLNIDKLENIKIKDDHSVTARCPACAEEGHDRKGDHLFIADNGKFGCVVNPGTDGHEHRQRIFELIGEKEPHREGIIVKRPACVLGGGYKVIQKDVLGHLGRV
jgi:hypothetical protein